MQNDAAFDRQLTALRRRVRLLVAERTALAACAGAVAVCILLVALDKFRVLRVEWFHFAGLLGAGLVCGWCWGFARRLGNFEVARAAEERLRLKERLSSAVALGSLAERDPMVSALVRDAENHLTPVRAKRLFPRRFGRRGQVLLGLLALLAAAMILPEIPALQSKSTRQERAALKKQGERLVKLARRLERRPPPRDVTTKKVLKQVALNLKALGKDMQTARITRKQALVKLNKLEKQVKAAQSNLGGSGRGKSLAKAAEELQTAQDAEAQMRAEKMARLMSQVEDTKTGKMPPDGEKFKELTPEQMKALEKLATSMRTLQSQGLDLPDDLLKALADALTRKDVQEALRILQRLQRELLAKKDAQEALRILQRVAKRLQTEEALRELAELAKKLQDEKTLRKMSPEDMKRLADKLVAMAKALKNTDLDALAKQLLELAKALERGDIKMCQRCANKVGGT